MAQKLLNNDGSEMQHGLAVPKGAADGQMAKQALRQLEEIDPDALQPLEYRVLLRVVEVDEITEGGLLKPESFFEKEMFAKTYAVFVSCGDEAFTDGSGNYIRNKPQKGDRIITTKYAGNVYRDQENNLYRFCNDKDIVATIKE